MNATPNDSSNYVYQLDYSSAEAHSPKVAKWIVATALVGLALTLFIPNVMEVRRPCFQSRAAADVTNWTCAVERFHLDTGRYPTNTEGLDVLIDPPTGGIKGWKGPYIDAVLRRPDPWGNSLVYRDLSSEKKDDFVLLTLGPDGSEGTADDFSTKSLSSAK